MKSSILFLFISVLFISLYFIPSTALAQAYSWTESNGKTVYGTKPPKSANNVQSLAPRGLSRYSSSKVLDRLGWRGSLNSEAIPEMDLGVIQEGDLPALENLPIEDISETPKDKSPAKLETSKLKITLDVVNSKIINRCKVDVTNIGGTVAKDVAVAFEFRDGTLIPAAGPANLDPDKTAVYKIPSDLLPLKLNIGLTRKNPEKAVKVVLDLNK